MPVLFNPTHLTFSKLNVKSITTALSGALRTTIEGFDNPKGFRMAVPFHLARAFIKREKGGDYLVPKLSEVILYEGVPVALESFPYSAYVNDPYEDVKVIMAKWVSRTRRAIDGKILPYLADTDLLNWYIDGYVVYGLPDKSHWVEDSVPLNKDGTFRRMRVPVFKISEIADGAIAINEVSNLLIERDCLVFNAPDNNVYITPPLWTNLGQIGSKKLDSTSTDQVDTELFDYIDDQLHVNIAFALEVAQKITDIFGYEVAEPLQLPELIIEYRTINLQKLPKEVKQTAPCGISFTHVLAWLFGVFKDPDNLEMMLTFRSILKVLTTRGLQVGDVMSDSQIFKEGMTRDDVGMLDHDAIEFMRGE